MKYAVLVVLLLAVTAMPALAFPNEAHIIRQAAPPPPPTPQFPNECRLIGDCKPQVVAPRHGG